MGFVAELIGGPHDGRIEEVHGRPDALFVPVLTNPTFSELECIDPSKTFKDLCYLKRVGLDGELRYVWNQLRP